MRHRRDGFTARILALVLGVVLAGGASAAVFPAGSDSLALGQHIEYLPDPSGSLTIDAVRQGEFPGRFRDWSGSGAFNQGYSNTVYWLRFPVAVSAEGPRRLLLEARYFALESLVLFPPNGEPVEGGLDGAADPRLWPHRFPTFVIQPGTEPAYYYLRLSSRGSLTLPLTLWMPEAFAAKTDRGYFLLALYFGGLLALVLFNFLLFLSLRDLRYLLYVLYAGFLGVGLLALEGVGGQLLWPDTARVSTLASNGAFSLGAVFAVLFAQHFLATRHFTPRLHRVLTAAVAVFAGNALLALGDIGIQFSSWILSVGVPIASGVILATAVLAYRQGSRGARFFLLAWGILLGSSMVAGLRNLGWVATTPLTSNILPMGSAVEMILLALALADRIHQERADRAAAQEEALAAKQQLVANLTDSERRLEQEVAERTAEAEASRHHFQSLLEASPVGIIYMDRERHIRTVNQAALDIVGYREEQVLGSTPQWVYASKAEYERLGREAYPVLREGGTYDTVVQMRRADDQTFPATMHARAVNPDDLSAGFIWILQDISEQKRLEEELRLLATSFRNNQATFITDAQGVIERVNPAFTAITGYQPEEVNGATPRLFQSGLQDKAFYANFWHKLLEHGHWEGEIWNQFKDGVVKPLYEAVSVVRNEAGAIEHFVAVFHDISEQKRLEAELSHEASHDRLTGVYNRKHFEELLDSEIERAQRYGDRFSLAMFDIDHFKAFNDTYGHDVGDAVLKRAAERVHAELRSSDSLARWGGEEFMLILPQTPIGEAEKLAERLRKTVFEADEDALPAVSISLAVTEYEPGEGADTILRRLDDALYRAKAEGRNRVIRI